jgi:GntR family transcriptional regulator, transcriptional repressor for pyruvate dehydrogenase complex
MNDITLLKISTVDAAVNYLKAQIEQGKLKPGDQLPSERVLQTSLRVSRYTLREALAKLNALGIIESTHGKGSFIAREMSPSSLGDVFLPLFANQDMKGVIDFFEARMIIESEAVVLCAERRSEEDLKRLHNIVEESKSLIDDPLQFGEMDFQFHREISFVTGNVFIQRMMDCLNDYIKRYLLSIAVNPVNRKGAYNTHLKIFEYIKKKETRKVREITRKHLSRSLNLLRNIHTQNGSVHTSSDLVNLNI